MCRCHLGVCIFKSEGNYLFGVLMLENRRNSVRYNYKHSIPYVSSTLGERVSHDQRVSIMIRVRIRLQFYVFNGIGDLRFPTLKDCLPPTVSQNEVPQVIHGYKNTQ
jgi:hypothetical protein